MKANAIVRIVIYILIIILLCAILAAGIAIGTLSFSFGSHESLTEGSGSVAADLIENIEIDWVAGEIILQTDPESDMITFTEKVSSKDDQPMGYTITDGTLLLCFSHKRGIQLSFSSVGTKTLIITVPADWVCDELSIDAASTDATISNLTINKIDLDSASNRFMFNNCHISSLDVDGASNEIHITGYLEKLDCDGMSTKISADLVNTPNRLYLDGISSQLELTLPVDCGFHVSMDGMSNHFSSEFDTKFLDDAYIYGDRRCQITVDGMSSDISIYMQK